MTSVTIIKRTNLSTTASQGFPSATSDFRPALLWQAQAVSFRANTQFCLTLIPEIQRSWVIMGA